MLVITYRFYFKNYRLAIVKTLTKSHFKWIKKIILLKGDKLMNLGKNLNKHKVSKD